MSADVQSHHFSGFTTPAPYNMFTGTAQESPAPSIQRRTTPLRPAPSDASNPHTRVSAPVDTPMSDAGPIAPTASQPFQQNRSVPQSASNNFAPRAPSSSQIPSEPPPSPRFAGRQQPTASATSQHSLNQPRSVPSSVQSSASPSPAFTSTSSPNIASPPPRIKVRSLSHIQSFAADSNNPLSQQRSTAGRSQPAGNNDAGPQYEISEMPVTDIIEMVAGLLTKITTTNDRQHEHLHAQIPPPDGTAGLSQQTTSVLAFHGKNVPSISILSYLSRIHKYCPTTYEVFLSLLVYFDRMTERVNAAPLQSLRQANEVSLERAKQAEAMSGSDGSRHSSIDMNNQRRAASSSSNLNTQQAQAATPPPSGSLGHPTTNSDSSSSGSHQTTTAKDDATTARSQHPPSPPFPSAGESTRESDPYNLSHFFVVDSFNIHRLVIAGVTCASKFFSDIFYTNSRYAKVGGLPLQELNHLEIQFLLLNDFRLSIPLEEMEAYGTMLVEFYAREIVAQQHPSAAGAGYRGPGRDSMAVA
ncbi:cyclin-domain-containing protein [Aulographum hederae CBS 113979]|uniref:Cyclin-domain-containing protein n=1 Tax=Aulographum hederae CBS 113979 TaxID=1176131 RepID=A0A6G1H3U2_9PEZI|nr:cyclin-domain-containing protein [Aulographum hederae CBS 113979]